MARDDGKLNALIIGPVNPREFTEVTSTTEVVAPIANATAATPPSRRWQRPERAAHSRCAPATPTRARMDGLNRDASIVRGIGVLPVFAGFLGLLLLVGSLAATSAREGK